jgi:pyruvate dehydrogenase E2 component (dihydrolipoamide acetyltransferase)
MAEYVRMPQKGLTEESALLAEWYVKKGDTVKVGQPLFALETGKAAFDVESEVSGTVLDTFAKEGDEIPIKSVVMVIGEPGEEYDTAEVGEDTGAAQEGPSSGQQAAASTSEDVPAAASASSTASSTNGASAASSLRAGKKGPKISPRARKLAKKHGVFIDTIGGSGPGGRIIVDDVKAAMASGQKQEASAEAARTSPQGVAAPDQQTAASSRVGTFTQAGWESSPASEVETIQVSKMRSIIAKRLSDSFFTAPHTFIRIVLSVDSLLEARKRFNTELDTKLSLNAFFIKLAAEAIKRRPIINSTWKESTIEIFKTIDIGLAVALPEGLITPIVRDCGNKGVETINAELMQLIEKAKSGNLEPREYTGATFTISNLGSYGVEEFTAIINPPGSAILALGEAVKETVVTEDDEIEIQKRMRVTLSSDHRVIDGAAGAAFLRDFKLMIEDPLRLILK